MDIYKTAGATVCPVFGYDQAPTIQNTLNPTPYRAACIFLGWFEIGRFEHQEYYAIKFLLYGLLFCLHILIL